MAHDHAHGGSGRRRLVIALAIVAVVLVVEVVGSAVSGSLALLADAGHMLSDLIGLVVALLASTLALRPATDRQTFGFRRAEVFGALINGVILAVVALGVAAGAIGRLVAGESDVRAGPMLVVAGIGLVANLASVAVLRPASAESINLRGAYLEVLGDAIGSVTAVIAAVVILTTGFAPADAIASLVIAALILPRAVVLLRDVARVLSEAVPTGTDVAVIREHILATPGVVDVHDVHVWAITSGSPVFSAHVVVESAALRADGAGRLLDELAGCLTDHFDVAHSTFQLEPAEHAGHETPQHR